VTRLRRFPGYAVGFRSLLVLSLGGARLRVPRKIAASTAIFCAGFPDGLPVLLAQCGGRGCDAACA
jgi:hypothetical protein